MISVERKQLVERERQAWIKRLIDLSRRNNLLYFRPLKTGTLDLTSTNDSAVVALIAGEPMRVSRLLGAGGDSAEASTEKENIVAHKVQEIARRFDSLAATGGIVPSAKTPEEHYHNARVHELGGNFAAARKEYVEYLASNLDLLDPWQSYAAMLKAQEGRAGALETLRYFGERLQPPTVSYQIALALLEEGDARLKKLQALADAHPDFGPLPYLISQEFSEARRGEQTLADQRGEKQWLEKFRQANGEGRFEKYFLDKKEAQLKIEHYWAGALRRAVIDGDVENGSLMAGQSVGMVTKVQPCQEIVDELVAQAEQQLCKRVSA